MTFDQPTGSNPQGPMQPLNIGNVVSAALRLYQSRRQAYLGISLRAMLWLGLPFLFFIIGGIFIAGLMFNEPMAGVLFFPFILIALPVYLFALAKYLANATLIGRLAFGDLTNQPESVTAARKQVDPKLWQIWLASFLVGLVNFAISFGFSLILNIFTVAIGISSGGDSAVVAAIFSGLVVILQIISLGVQLWVGARLFLVQLPIVVEENVSPANSLGRSWSLTQGNAWRVLVVILVAFLITLPIYSLSGIALVAMIVPIVQGVVSPEASPEAFLLSIVPAFLGFIILTIIAAIIVTPFWETLKAVVYFDLRSRREGLGLQLRDRRPV
jgi:hypothetical protein